MPKDREQEHGGRGQRAGFDPRSGAVSGSGAGIANPDAGENYDDDEGVGTGGISREKDPSNGA